MHIHLSFKKKLLFAFSICSVIPLLLCSIFMVQSSKLELENQERSYLEQQIVSLTKSLDIISEGLKGIALQLNNNPFIENALTENTVDQTKINNLLYLGTSVLRNYASLELYDLEGNLRYSTSDNYEKTNLPTWWGILHTASLKNGELAFQAGMYESDNENPCFRGSVLLKDKDDIPMGYIVLTMHQKDFYNLFEVQIGTKDSILLVNNFFRPIYSSSKYLNTEISKKIREELLNGTLENEKKSDFIYEVQKHTNTGLYIILLRQKALNYNTSRVFYIASIIFAILGIIIGYLISIPLRNQIFSPVQKLQWAFKELGDGNLKVQLPMGKTEEINQLSRDFNKMVTALRHNQRTIVQKQKEINQAQINLMQTQLNPHFLCNTLDTVKWISKINNVPQIAEISASLAEILRFGLLPDQFVPLYREIDIINLYIDIQKIRMSERFSFTIEVPEEFEEYMVPKMLLQPIVENSIIHGLDGKDFIDIKITAHLSDNNLVIKVIDNGMGIPDNIAGRKYQHTQQKNGHHLGLNNINTIIEKQYGENYGVYLDKGENNIGTVVTVIIPCVKESNKGAL